MSFLYSIIKREQLPMGKLLSYSFHCRDYCVQCSSLWNQNLEDVDRLIEALRINFISHFTGKYTTKCTCNVCWSIYIHGLCEGWSSDADSYGNRNGTYITAALPILKNSDKFRNIDNSPKQI